MPNRGSISSGASVVDHARCEQQADPSTVDVDPASEPIDVPVRKGGIFQLHMLRTYSTRIFDEKERELR